MDAEIVLIKQEIVIVSETILVREDLVLVEVLFLYCASY